MKKYLQNQLLQIFSTQEISFTFVEKRPIFCMKSWTFSNSFSLVCNFDSN